MIRRVKTLDRIVGISLMVLVVGAGCSPLPGGSVDPVYLRMPGKKATEEPVQPKSAAAAPESPSSLQMGSRMWVGRYRDSRGEGEITLSLVRSQSMMSGTWKARMGGGGPVIATLEAGGRQWQLRMENSAAECPGTFEGWLEARGAALVGTYRGRDCEGAVSDGSFELREK